MVAPVMRPQRFLPPTRESSESSFVVDLEQKKPNARTRDSSPSIVRCSCGEEPKASLDSAIKPLDTLPSQDASSTVSVSKRTVGFAPRVAVKDTLSVWDMTDGELDNYWLSDEDYHRIRKRNRMLIRLAEKFQSHLGKPLPPSHSAFYKDCEDDIEHKPDGDYLCIRGLESATRSGSMRKRTYRRNSIQQVLLEQEFQRFQSYPNDEAIAEVYIEEAFSCKFRAVHLAMEDRLEATNDQ